MRKNKDKKAESNPGEVHTKVRRRTDTARDDFNKWNIQIDKNQSKFSHLQETFAIVFIGFVIMFFFSLISKRRMFSRTFVHYFHFLCLLVSKYTFFKKLLLFQWVTTRKRIKNLTTIHKRHFNKDQGDQKNPKMLHAKF